MSLTLTAESVVSDVESGSWKRSLGRRSSSMAKKEIEQCKVFKPFPLATDVCDDCGEIPDNHPEKRSDMLPYKEALWKYMLEVGGPYSFYGHYDTWKAHEIKEHLKSCELDFDKMSTPAMDQEQMFTGTFDTETHYVDLVKGYIVCKCGEYEQGNYSFDRQDWCVRDKTLSQLIWHVVKAGENN
jgi:hypothetical protein